MRATKRHMFFWEEDALSCPDWAQCMWEWPEPDMWAAGSEWPDMWEDPACPIHGTKANTVRVFDLDGKPLHVESYYIRCLCGECVASKGQAVTALATTSLGSPRGTHP